MIEVEVALPRQFKASALFTLVEQHFDQMNNLPDKVVFNFAGLGFALPSGVVFLSNLSRFLIRNSTQVEFRGMDVRNAATRFLDDALFFEQHIGAKLSPQSRPRPTTQPLQEIRHHNSHAWLRATFIPWLSNCSSIPEVALAEVTTCLAELFNNINDHTAFDVGCLFAQWFPQRNRLCISIADFGAGIPNAVRSVEPKLSDHQAIERAFEDGFSSQSTPRNRGVGLHLLLQNVVERFHGNITVRSQTGFVKHEMIGNSVRTVSYIDQGFCPGTMIDIEFRTDLISLEDIGEPVEFEW